MGWGPIMSSDTEFWLMIYGDTQGQRVPKGGDPGGGDTLPAGGRTPAGYPPTTVARGTGPLYQMLWFAIAELVQERSACPPRARNAPGSRGVARGVPSGGNP